MRISYRWLKELVEFDLDPEELARRLTLLGLEIESIERPGAEVREVWVGRILEIKPHPDADKLVVCQTDVGKDDPLQIVCGAKNMKVGDLVPTAVVGATLPGGFAIGRRKMRGVESQGMMCSARELGLGQDHDGLLILPQDLPIGADAIPLLGLDDVILEIEVTPNRGDWAGMIGVARELAASLGTRMILPDANVGEAGGPVGDLSSVTIEDTELCPRYTGRVLTDVQIGPSPLWMVQRLVHAGQRAISNIVDITNYVMLETGHPLHAFDYHKLLQNKIVVRRAKQGETIKTIDEQVRSLEEHMLVIADAENPVAVAGVMGGFDSEVGEDTSTLFLESAYFQPQSVRRTSKALGLQSESSTRFQRGADPEMARFALDRAAALIEKLAGAKCAKGVLDEYPGRAPARTVTLRYARTNALLGGAVEPDAQDRYLESLGFGIEKSQVDSCNVSIPSWRYDVTQEADLIEEVARLHGYDTIPSSLPRVRKTEQVYAPAEKTLRKLKHFLAGIGLCEMMSLSFASQSDTVAAGLEQEASRMILLENPLSENHAGMRASLLPAMLQTVSTNLRRGVESVGLFEIAKVYISEGQELPDEPTRLCIALAGRRGSRHWSAEPRTADFYDLKGIGESVASFFGVSLILQSLEQATFEPGHAAALLYDEQSIGALGKINDDVAARFNIERPVYVMDMALEPLLKCVRADEHFEAVSVFPPSLRDMAVVLDEAVPAGEVLETARAAAGKLLQRIEIFDVYTGKQVPEGKKSLALGLVFQSPDRTLTDKDTQKSWDKILRTLQDKFEAQLR
ncbi:MAG: phenylalanine--tRNA ligase beta subunit [Candidatus Hydrogenedentota bacterium]